MRRGWQRRGRQRGGWRRDGDTSDGAGSGRIVDRYTERVLLYSWLKYLSTDFLHETLGSRPMGGPGARGPGASGRGPAAPGRLFSPPLLALPSLFTLFERSPGRLSLPSAVILASI